MAATLTINGTEMPEPALNGITVTKEAIWSKNTGRTTSGKMTGDIVARKTKLKISWPVLNASQVSSIDKAIDGAFFSVKYLDPNSNSFKTITMYAGTPTYPLYNYVDGKAKYVGVGVDLIEQ